MIAFSQLSRPYMLLMACAALSRLHSPAYSCCTCRAWQMLESLPLEASQSSLARLQSWLAGLEDSAPEAVAEPVLAKQRQAVANADAWAAPVCSWLQQHR